MLQCKQTHRLSQCWKIILLAVTMFACRAGGDMNSRQSGSGENSAKGTVEVSVDVSNESPDEFRSAGDSVQIGGTNLTSMDLEDTLIIYRLTTSGAVEFERKQFKGNQLSFKIPAGDYYTFQLDRSKLAALLPPSFNKFKKVQARVSMDRTSTISSKIATLISENARSGHKSSIDIIESKTLAARDVYTVATASKTSITLKSPVTGQPATLNLSKLAIDLADAVAAKAAVYPADQFSRQISAAAFDGPLYSSRGDKNRNDVAAFETSNPGGSQPGRVASIKYFNDLSDPSLISAFDATAAVVSSNTSSDNNAFNQAVMAKFEENFSTPPAAEPPPTSLPPTEGSSSSPPGDNPSPPPSTTTTTTTTTD